MGKTKYTKELLESLVKNSISVSQVLKKLGLKLAGGNHNYISTKIKDFGIDTTHFLGQAHRRGAIGGPDKKPWQDILIVRKTGRRQAAHRLRRALIESGRKYMCEICGSPPVWNQKELRLQIDHKNGNWLDDRKENIRFVCPNCHTQTKGFCGSKGFTEVTTNRIGHRDHRRRNRGLINRKACTRRKDFIYSCPTCNKNFNPRRKEQKYCSHLCATKSKRKPKPTKEQLEQEIKENSWLALGRKYNVSDNAVRKWAKGYNLIT